MLEFKETFKKLTKDLPKFEDGRINYSDAKQAPVLTCFVKYNEEILLLKRSDKVRTYQGMWTSVAGYLDELIPLEEKALEELKEELGIKKDLIKEIKLGKAYKFKDEKIDKTWFIFPVLIELNKRPNIQSDWEHTEYRWIDPKDLDGFNIVPNLDKSLKNALS